MLKPQKLVKKTARSKPKKGFGDTIEWSRIATASLSPSEKSVAEYVQKSPEQAMQFSIAQLADAAHVSQPTVARFCHAVGFTGFKDFRLWLARTLGAGTPYVHADVSATDSAGQIFTKICERTQAAVSQVRMQIDDASFERATHLLSNAPRIEFYGQGNSGITAQDAAHKFFRLGIPTAAHADPHVHSVSAAMLEPGSVVVGLSNSGRARELIDTIKIARQVGATVIALTAPGTPLAQLADVVLPVNPNENPDVYAPMTARIAQLVIIDALAVAVALAKGPELQNKLQMYKRILADKQVLTKINKDQFSRR